MGAHPIVTLPSRESLPLSIIVEESQVIRRGHSSPPCTPLLPILAPRRKNWLSEALLEASPTRPQRRVGDVLLSVVLHAAVLAAALAVPLYFTQTIDLRRFTETLLVPPPPPPPAPAVAADIAKARPAPQRRFLTGGKLLAPVVIPNRVVILKEEPLALDDGMGVAGGVPGGVPGGQMGGVLGGVIGGLSSRTYVAPPSTPQPRAPIRVGGRVKPPRALVQPAPAYPPLAKQTRLQGVVSIDAVIDSEGNVVEMQVISGAPLLIPAALEAVRQWKYEPTYLNDQPIAVQLIVKVTFQLSQ